MKNLFKYVKSRPLAIISLAFICLLYVFMIFAEFVAPYSPSTSFESDTFHPVNIELSLKGLTAREYRVLNPSSWSYAKVKGFSHRVSFFVKGEQYRLFGIIPSDRHLFGTKPDSVTGQVYPVFIMGADNLGRDMFSRLVYGSRISLTIGFAASAISLLLAIVFGGLAGFFGGLTDWSVMRLAEFFMLIPSLYLILFLRSLLNSSMDSGQSYMIITLILSLVGWPGTSRTLRGMVHSIKREEFVQNAVLEKIPSLVIIFRYIVPQISSLLIVSTTLAVPGFIMSETTLSYLGLGIADPAVSWGSMINREISTISNLKNFPWLLNPVWILLAVTLAYNFLGDALRDYFDPYHVVFKKGSILNLFKGKSLSPGPRCAVATPLSSGDTPQRPDTLLSVERLSVVFRVQRGNETAFVQSVRDVSFELKKGEILGVVGESGSGKSVSTTAITGLLPLNAEVQGSVFYNENGTFTDLASLSSKELRSYRGKKIGMIFQESGRAFDPLQNMESVFFETISNSDPEITKEEAHKKACSLLEEVGITDAESRLKNFPHQFSGGQLQRIGIALSLAQGCELLIADEPTTALDVTVQAQIVSLLKTLNQTRGLSIIFISHDIELVSRLCSRIIVMYGGKIMEKGSAMQIKNNPLHPYTQALIASSPEFGTHWSKEKLISIPGRVTDPAHPEPGCPFASRCSFAADSCVDPEFICYKMKEKTGEKK